MGDPVDMRFRRDRVQYRWHAITLIVGFVGLLGTIGLGRVIDEHVVPWLLLAFSFCLSASGVLAIMVKRTMFSNPGSGNLEAPDPYETAGDALETPGIWTGDLAPSFSNAAAPYAILGIGLLLVAGSLYFVFTW